jgi:hypothetical protein
MTEENTNGQVELTDAEAQEVAETAPLATFRVGKADVPLLRTKQLELGELGYLKRERGIRGMVDLEDGLLELDPDAWSGLLYVSARRVLPAIDADHPELRKVLVMPLLEESNRLVREALDAALEAKRGEVDEEGPPAVAGDGDGAAPRPRRRSTGTRGGSGDRT